MEKVCFFETPVCSYESTRRGNPEHHLHLLENLRRWVVQAADINFTYHVAAGNAAQAYSRLLRSWRHAVSGPILLSHLKCLVNISRTYFQERRTILVSISEEHSVRLPGRKWVLPRTLGDTECCCTSVSCLCRA